MNFLGNKLFLQFCVPLIAVALSIFLKYVSRNDRHKDFRKEDLAIGLDLSVTALIIFVTASSQVVARVLQNPADNALATKSMAIPWVLSAYLVGIWGLSTLVRKLGWESEDRLKTFWGIVVPDIYGLSALLVVVDWIA
jgi:hypothetical protein